MRNLQHDRETGVGPGDARTVDMRRRKIAQAGSEKSADSDPPFLSGRERSFSDEMAPCRSPAMAARPVRYSGIVSTHAGLAGRNRPAKKYLDFRIYFAIIKSALAVYPRTSKTRRNG